MRGGVGGVGGVGVGRGGVGRGGVGRVGVGIGGVGRDGFGRDGVGIAGVGRDGLGRGGGGGRSHIHSSAEDFSGNMFLPEESPKTGSVSSMPAYPMGKMGNCPGPRAQGGPALAERVIENQRKRGEKV